MKNSFQPQQMPHLNRREQIWLAAGLSLFALCSFPWLSLPGPYHDELLFVPVLEPFTYGSTLYSWRVADTEIPIMIMSYVGALKALLMKAIFVVCPPTMATVRGSALLLGMATVWLTLIFVRRHYSSVVAVAATLLLATDPSFIHTIRIDWGPVALMQFLKMAGLVLISGWLVSGRLRLWIAGMFVFGLAVWDKATFVWILLPLALAVLVLFPRQTLQRFSYRNAAIGALAFLLGSLPFWIFNLNKEGQTASETWNFEFQPDKLYAARSALDGSAVLWLLVRDDFEAAEPPEDIALPQLASAFKTLGKARSSLSWSLMILSVLLLPITLRTRHRRAVLFPLIVSLGIYLLMFPFRSGGGSAHHVVMVYPFPLLFVAASLAVAREKLKLRLFVPLVVAAAVFWNVSLNARYLAGYTHTGGSGNFTDAIYDLAPYMHQNPEQTYYLLDWGISNPLAFLGEPYEIKWEDLSTFYFGSEPPEASAERLRNLLANPQSRFVVRGAERTAFPAKWIDRHVEQGRITKTRVFHERLGVAAFEVYRPVPGPADGVDGAKTQPAALP